MAGRSRLVSALVMILVLSGLALPMPVVEAQNRDRPARENRNGRDNGQAAATEKAPATQPAKPARENVNERGVPTTSIVGWLEISGPLRDGPPPFALIPGMETKHSMSRVLEQLQHVQKDKRTRGAIIYLDEPELTLSQIYDLSQAIKGIRDAGKKVMVFSESYDLKGYLLACAADEILLQRKGMLELEGLGLEEWYFAGLFEKIGVKADFLQVGKYKGASEPFTRKGPSPEWSQTFDALLDSLYGQMTTRIAAARKLTAEKVQKAFADCFTMSDEEYLKRGLVDRLVDRDLTDVTGDAFGERFEWDEDMGAVNAPLQANNPFALFQLLVQERKPQITRPTLAVLHAYGPIMSGESEMSGSPAGPSAGLFGGEKIGSRTLVRTLGDLRDNDHVKGVVIRIDSPGGSALASEVIWQAVRELGKEKPVFVSIGGMAASGGYYIACAGDQIYATPSSIVGSIGVVGGKFVMSGLYDWAGLSVHRRSRGPLGDLFNTVEPFTAEQRKSLQAAFDRIYEQFTSRVTAGRGKRITDLAAVAQGRIFTGQMGTKNGLVDKLGSLEDAINDLAKQVKLEPGKYDIVNLPEPQSFPEYLSNLLGVQGRAPGLQLAAEQTAALRAAEAALGPAMVRQLRSHLGGLLLLRHEHVLTLMPTAIVVK